VRANRGLVEVSSVKMFRRILVATDFSQASTPALEQAGTMARRDGAVLLIAHAYQEPGLAELSQAPARAYPDWDQELREAAEKRLQPLVESARKEGIKAEALILRGFADEAIVAAAKHQRADLIVMGTHGRRGPARLFLGSVASRVISTAPCPVLTVRSA
jgi:nucleotide-binding universal stress UspA family protein